VFNEGTTKVDAWAFKNCENLVEVYVPSSLTEINEKAFEGCPNVKIVKK
jgi:ferredoxin